MKRLAIMIFVLALLLPLVVSAQSVPPAGGGPSGCTALTPEEANIYVGLLGGAPAGAKILAVYICRGFGTYVIGDAGELFDRTCEEVNVYKVSSEGDQDLWQSDARVCTGNQVAIQGGGTGHYIVYGYPSEAVEDAAPIIIRPLNIGGA